MKQLLTTTAVIVAFAVPANAATLTSTFTSFYAFGDSLTDDGKLGTLNAPSLDGRFSNGEVYAEIIAQEFEQAGLDTGNLALGGATAGDENANAFAPLSTFGGQVDVFAGSLASGTGLPTAVAPTFEVAPTGPDTGDNPLVSVFFGANDIFAGQDVIAAANAVADGIRDLAALGSQFDDFLVLGLPDIGDTPAFSGSIQASAASNAFNGQLLSNITDLEAEGLSISYFDTDAVFQEIIASVENATFEFGIFDATTPCTVSFSETGPSCLDAGIEPNTLLFGDAVHPSAPAQALVADRIIAQVEGELSVVPLPASMAFMIFGIAAFGAARMRKVA